MAYSSLSSALVPCTLFSGDYHFGAGALANSLYRSGFRGTMLLGYQPPLPPWASTARQAGTDTLLQLAPDFVLRFVAWPTRHNLSLEKPRFMLHALDVLAPEAQGVLFFDADIVVKASWSFFENWIALGAAVCLDVGYPIVPANHPWRKAWRDLAAGPCHDLDYYVNSGFVGLSRAHRALASNWALMIDRFLESRHEPIDTVKFDARESAFTGDQDMLNAALMATDVPLSIIGRDGMDFIPGGFLMSHAIEEPKPWRRRFIASAFGGRPPSAAEKAYWRCVEAPIRLFPAATVAATRASIRVASSIGRFYSRNR